MIALIFILGLTLQVQVPTAPASTWDGVPGSEVVRTDPGTGEITYPMGEQPPDALALGCVFGRSNVRCPKPPEPSDFGALSGADAGSAGDGADTDDAAASAFDWFAEAYVKDPATLPIAEQIAGAASSTDLIFPSDMLAGSGIDASDSANEKYAEAEPEPELQRQSGCHREEYRYENGSGGGVRVVCSSGDQRLLDSVIEGLPSSPR